VINDNGLQTNRAIVELQLIPTKKNCYQEDLDVTLTPVSLIEHNSGGLCSAWLAFV
jgi:hypothetical protein